MGSLHIMLLLFSQLHQLSACFPFSWLTTKKCVQQSYNDLIQGALSYATGLTYSL